jgi:hypothetical protein
MIYALHAKVSALKCCDSFGRGSNFASMPLALSTRRLHFWSKAVPGIVQGAMLHDRLDKFEKTGPTWSDIALLGNNVIIAASVVAFLLIAGLGYYVLR